MRKPTGPTKKKVYEAIENQPKGSPYVVLKETVVRAKCKTCGEKERRSGSAYCGGCATKFHSGL